ncbi:hypothetical protein niasHT_034950 [Heterodera trifolii]|uniref:Uncharacterized protein n=1 Tax=Heterodera trifolii TaxID=157864 RepID=A0ABD2I8R9_9BILA
MNEQQLHTNKPAGGGCQQKFGQLAMVWRNVSENHTNHQPISKFGEAFRYVVEIVAQRQQHQSVPQQRHHFAKMGLQKWPIMPPKPTTNLTTMAQQQNERRKNNFGTKVEKGKIN